MDKSSPHDHADDGRNLRHADSGLTDPVCGMNVTAQAAGVPAGTIFTCPMHPEIRQNHPGVCPKCGMALEPEQPALGDAENPELADFKRRF